MERLVRIREYETIDITYAAAQKPWNFWETVSLMIFGELHHFYFEITVFF